MSSEQDQWLSRLTTQAMNGQQIEPKEIPQNSTRAEESVSAARIRRRNRMITSCLECRRRKLKCDKQSPCTNCSKFSRECMFLAPALDSVSQKKLNEIKEKMGTLERTLEEDVARRKSDAREARRVSSADLPGEGSESDEEPVPEDEKGLEPTPMATVDATYESSNETNDDILDLGFRVGKFRMSERLGGLFRPKLAEEMVFALVRDNKRGTEPEAPLKDDANTFLDPGPTFIAPGSGFIFGDTGNQRNVTDYLPSKSGADLLMKRYHINCHFVARVVHWPSFQMQYDTFWTAILSGVEPPPSLQALFFSMCFSAVASMSYSEVDTVFHQSHRRVLSNFQRATEIALAKSNVLRTNKFETLQGLIIYLIPMCRGEVSRAHSTLVGAAIRLGECFSLHRDPVEAFGYSPVEAHVRRLAWFQLCYLDFRTVEAQGPRPQIKREDYDTKLPWNIDDDELLAMQPTSNQPVVELREKEAQWTDATLSKIRFECCEMHRIVWFDRIRLDKNKVSITHCLSKIESFRNAMEKKYSWLDISITIQHYARILLDLLLLRMHIMILHKYHNATSSRIPDRLRQIVLSSGTKITESAVKLDVDPKFECFKWYNTALQQWHTAFLLLTEVFIFPNRKEADRIWSVIDHVFEPDLTLSRVQKARSILAAVRDRAAAYRELRRMKEPLSMRGRLNTHLPARGRIRGPDMILPPPDQAKASMRRGSSNIYNGHVQDHQQISTGPVGNTQDTSGSWNFDFPSTLFMRDQRDLTSMLREMTSELQNQNNTLPDSSPAYRGMPQIADSSPSNSSELASWPPSINIVQEATYLWKKNNSMSPPQYGVSSPEGSAPSPQFGNSAMGVVSGKYIPNTNLSPHTPDLAYSNVQSPNPISTGTPGESNDDASARLMMMGMLGSGQFPTTNLSAPRPMPNMQDIPMLDIDWSEWDKLFPIEMNNGELDMPVITTQQ